MVQPIAGTAKARPPAPSPFIREQQLLSAFRKLDERGKATILAMVSAAAKLGSGN